jgi:hypothetical protein
VDIKLIVKGKELSNISEAAKKWFYESILNGNSGAFTCAKIGSKTNGILLIEPKNPNQKELFK